MSKEIVESEIKQQDNYERNENDIISQLEETKIKTSEAGESKQNSKMELELDEDKTNNEKEKQFVVFQLDDQEYGIDIMQVYEINRLKEIAISPIPKTPRFVEGIINLRGEVVPVVDLRKKLELQEKSVDKKSRILIIKVEKKMIGLLVDAVKEVIDILENDIAAPPEEVTDISTRYLTGVAKIEKKLVLLLNVNEIILTVEDSENDKAIER